MTTIIVCLVFVVAANQQSQMYHEMYHVSIKSETDFLESRALQVLECGPSTRYLLVNCVFGI